MRGLFDGAVWLGKGRYSYSIGGGYGATASPDIYVMKGRIIAATERWEYGFHWPWQPRPKRHASPDYETEMITEAQAIKYLTQGGVPLASFIDKLPNHEGEEK